MNESISAIFENGKFRPLSTVDLDEGEEVSVILLRKTDSDPAKSRRILSRIASLPVEGSGDEFSGADHDTILYPKSEQ
jgi:predicted DNA-binding antitoxin AbrB/MazE fold protein